MKNRLSGTKGKFMDTKSNGKLKGYVTISDVSKLCDVPSHTLRYWEKEFNCFFSPRRTKGNQRRYSDTDIEIIRKIKTLLWSDKFSIEGAKKILYQNMRGDKKKSRKEDRIRDMRVNGLIYQKFLDELAHYLTQQLYTAQSSV
jgi:DNA-binding transcriptional MerR regulator